MGYEKFSLTTLQLPAPASNLSKAEYKEKYGIDLDDIDINKFTLVVYNGDKYAIDQIKSIEDGYEIYFNGRILSITDIVQTSDEVYDVANSKPIYWHGIDMSNSDTKEYFEFHILNNSPDSINTIARLIAWLNSIEGRVVVSGIGSIKVSDVYYTLGIITKNADNSLTATYNTENGYNTTGINLSTAFNYIADAVNKIN